LNVVPIRLPDLCDRPEDIVPLATHFLGRQAAAEGVRPKEISPAAVEALSRYPWPGNVRELEHAVERAVVISASRQVLNQADFALDPFFEDTPVSPVIPHLEIPDSGFNLSRAVHEFEIALIDMAMRKAGGNKQRAANFLGMKRTSMIYKHKALEQFS
jgi:DNA-binding NtrC family response regulator